MTYCVLELILKNIYASCAASSGVSGYDASGHFSFHFRFIFLNFVNVQNFGQKLISKRIRYEGKSKGEYCLNSTFYVTSYHEMKVRRGK